MERQVVLFTSAFTIKTSKEAELSQNLSRASSRRAKNHINLKIGRQYLYNFG